VFPGLLNSVATINRSQAVGTNGRSQMQLLYTSVPCLVMPMNTTTAVQQKFSIGRAYDVYFAPSQDVQAGDALIVAGNTYVVKLTQVYNVAALGYVLAMTEEDIS
jgi:hypothetical protein